MAALAPLRERTFEATYIATLKDIPATASTLTVWIPLPGSRGGQRISDVEIDSPYKWHRVVDPIWKNSYAYATVRRPRDGELTVRVNFTATRVEVTPASLPETRASRDDLRRNLKADRLVTLSPRIRKLAEEITAGRTTVVDQARAIYDYVLTTMKYDKTTPGWGKGDTERACDVHAGNCTDFHSLFMSLARSKGIPARFVIGFPVPEKDGVTSGYHCWAEFYDRGRGWIPVDPSEASKTSDAARREYLFMNLDPDRVQFTIGRDIVLSPATNEPLNFFIYPHAESRGETVGVPSVALEVRDRTTAGSPAD
jgi:transglutaminase-like putative cysteine protease